MVQVGFSLITFHYIYVEKKGVCPNVTLRLKLNICKLGPLAGLVQSPQASVPLHRTPPRPAEPPMPLPVLARGHGEHALACVGDRSASREDDGASRCTDERACLTKGKPGTDVRFHFNPSLIW